MSLLSTQVTKTSSCVSIGLKYAKADLNKDFVSRKPMSYVTVNFLNLVSVCVCVCTCAYACKRGAENTLYEEESGGTAGLHSGSVPGSRPQRV